MLLLFFFCFWLSKLWQDEFVCIPQFLSWITSSVCSPILNYSLYYFISESRISSRNFDFNFNFNFNKYSVSTYNYWSQKNRKISVQQYVWKYQNILILFRSSFHLTIFILKTTWQPHLPFNRKGFRTTVKSNSFPSLFSLILAFVSFFPLKLKWKKTESREQKEKFDLHH